MDIAFDIETMPNSSMIEKLPELEVKTGNLKDPAKIAEKVAEAKLEQVSKMALSPLYGRICSIVTTDSNSVTIGRCIEEESDSAETELIERALISFGGENKRLISYNGNNFDLPFIYKRAILLGVDVQSFGMPTLAEMTARYNNKYHVDLMTVWCGYGGYEKLDNVAKAMFEEGKIKIDFRDFPELIKSAEGRTQIIEYNMQDAALTMQLWNRVAGILI